MIEITEIEGFYLFETSINTVIRGNKHDRDKATQSIKDNREWHNNMIRNVASYVARGLTNSEIQLLASNYTVPGYTDAETKNEVQRAIDGARNKGFQKVFGQQEIMQEKDFGPLLKQIGDGELGSVSYLVDGLIEDRTMSLIFGSPASGKSFVAMNIACSVAAGHSFFGKETLAGPVVYIAGEGKRGLRRRAFAWCQKNAVNLCEIPLLLSERSVSVLDDNEIKNLCKEIDIHICSMGAPKLIIFDTLNRNFGNGDENSNADMGKFVKSLEGLQHKYDCNILIIHHSGHSDKGRVRGASALTAAVDAEYCIKKIRSDISLSCTKMKDEEPPKTLWFKICPLTFCNTSKSIRAPLAVLEMVSRERNEDVLVPPKYAIALEALKEEELLSGEQILNCGPKSVTLDNWRQAFYGKYPSQSTEAKRKAFGRAKKYLIEEGVVDDENSLITRVEKKGDIY